MPVNIMKNIKRKIHIKLKKNIFNKKKKKK